MRPIPATLIALASLALCACVEIDTRITLSPDGGGTVETTTILDPILSLMMELGARPATQSGAPRPDLCSQLAVGPRREGLAIAHSVPNGHSAQSACTRTVTTADWSRDVETLFAGTLIEVQEHEGRTRIGFDAAAAIERITSDPDQLCANAADPAPCRAEAARIAQVFTDLPDTFAELRAALGGQGLAPSYRLSIEGTVRAVHGFVPADDADGTERAVFHTRCAPQIDPGCVGMLRSIRWAFETGPAP